MNNAKKTNKDKLLPCPFCGQREDLVFEEDNIHKTLITVCCNSCGCSIGYCGDREEAANIWNTRFIIT